MGYSNKNLHGKYLLSDVDGTLMGHDEIVSERNLAAIREFCEEGGRFGLATGRSVRSGRWIAQQVGANAPCILFNGAVVYDFEADKPIFVHRLPNDVIPSIKPVLKKLLKYRIVVSTLYQSYEIGANATVATFDEIPQDWIKIIFHVSPMDHDALVVYLKQNLCADVAVVSSSSTYVEILPLGVSKGAALTKFAETLGIGLDDIYVIGDYYNDKEMLETALHTACPANAPDDIKAICQRVVSSVEEGAVAEYIELISHDKR